MAKTVIWLKLCCRSYDCLYLPAICGLLFSFSFCFLLKVQLDKAIQPFFRFVNILREHPSGSNETTEFVNWVNWMEALCLRTVWPHTPSREAACFGCAEEVDRNQHRELKLLSCSSFKDISNLQRAASFAYMMLNNHELIILFRMNPGMSPWSAEGRKSPCIAARIFLESS